MTTTHTRRGLGTLGSLCIFVLAAGQVRAVEPPAEGPDAALQKALADLDRRAAEVHDLTADFRESKYTPLLRKPLVSEGVVRIRGSVSRWDAQSPHRIVTLIRGDEIRMYYPARSTVEVYQIGSNLRFLAVSPLPRLATLREHFRIRRRAIEEIEGSWDKATHLALRLIPKSDALRNYIETVDVVLDRETSYVIRAELLDADGDRTVLIFSDIRVNTGLTDSDLELDLEPGTRVVRPLAEVSETPEAEERHP